MSEPEIGLLRASLEELWACQPEYHKAQKFYDGSFAEPFTSLLLQQLLGSTPQRYKTVLSAVPVDAVVDKLRIVDVRASTPEGTAAVQAGIWKPNNMRLESKSAIRAAEKFGDAYLFVWPGESSLPGAVDDEVTDRNSGGQDGTQAVPVDEGPQTVSLFYNSPLSTRVFYDEDNPRVKHHAVKIKDCGGYWEAWLYLGAYAGYRIEYYRTALKKGKDAVDYQFVGEVPNELGAFPFIHLRNDFPYGSPLHKGAYGPQEAITKLIVNQLSTSDFAAFPQRWALKDTAATFGDDIEYNADDSTVPDDEETVSSLTSGPGRIWEITAKALGQFQAADVQQFLAPIETYVQMMGVTTNTPTYYFTGDGVGGGTPTGESIRQRDARLNSKTEWHRDALDAGFVEALELGLSQVLGVDDSVQITWAPVGYTSEKERLDLVKQKTALGVPLAVALAETGYDEDTVKAWTAATTDAQLQQRVQVLDTLGDAMSKLGAAKALGVDIADAEEVAAQVLAVLVAERAPNAAADEVPEQPVGTPVEASGGDGE